MPRSSTHVDDGSDELPAELIDHLCRLTSLDSRQARRVVVEMLGFMNETQHDFMCRRHRELQDQGLANAAIFRCIQRELLTHRFRATAVSERQIRRAIYG